MLFDSTPVRLFLRFMSLCRAFVTQPWDPDTGRTWCPAPLHCLKLLPWQPRFHLLPYMSMNTVHTTGLLSIQTGKTWRDHVPRPAVTASASQLHGYLSVRTCCPRQPGCDRHLPCKREKEKRCLIFTVARSMSGGRPPCVSSRLIIMSCRNDVLGSREEDSSFIVSSFHHFLRMDVLSECSRLILQKAIRIIEYSPFA